MSPRALALILLALAGCLRPDRHGAVDLAMTSAYRPGPGAPPAPAGLTLLAGDFHCHVAPPDEPSDVTRDLARTAELARREGLDFVVLTPHVGARFFLDDAYRAELLAAWRELRARIAALPPGGPLLVPGLEYTDHRFGHLGLAFADLEAVLAAESTEALAAAPERFFTGWVDAGGLVVLHHPLVLPLDSSLGIARVDLSWRPWTAEGPFPPEIAVADRLAQGVEAYNLTAAHLRDRYLAHPGPGTLEDTLARLDAEILRQQRRIAPLGGSDSHEDHLRAVAFVLAKGRSAAAVREAVLAGRTCVRDPAACSLEARVPGGAWQPVGAALEGEAVEVRAAGEATVLLDGREAARLAGRPAPLALEPGRCELIRARVGEGYSAPIYANCPFAR